MFGNLGGLEGGGWVSGFEPATPVPKVLGDQITIMTHIQLILVLCGPAQIELMHPLMWGSPIYINCLPKHLVIPLNYTQGAVEV